MPSGQVQALDVVGLVGLALDLEAGAALAQGHPHGRAHQQIGAGSASGAWTQDKALLAQARRLGMAHAPMQH